MFKLTFKGGVHPGDGKALTKEVHIHRLRPAGEMVYPMQQHIGKPAKPIVAVGERVLARQKIAEADGFVSVPVYASVSGVVKAIEPRMTVSGKPVLSVVVENDGKYEEAPKLPVLEPGNDAAWRKTLLDRIAEAGIVGMGGACFPTHVKLSPKDPEQIDYVIVNGAECEPYITGDYRRMLEDPEGILEGLQIILTLFPNARGMIGIEDNKPEAIRDIKEAAANHENIEVKAVKTKYPQGGERTLIYALTGRKINSDMLPLDARCIVCNVDTVYEIYRAVIKGRPLTKRVITVTGDAVLRPENFLVPLGISHRELIEAAGGFTEEPEKLISGGPMMGTAMMSLDVPVEKGSSCLLCVKKDTVAANVRTNCINCGRCVQACPGRVLPTRLAQAARNHDEETFIKLNGMECCECGCCSYICPAKLDLTQTIKSMRKDILGRRKK